MFNLFDGGFRCEGIRRNEAGSVDLLFLGSREPPDGEAEKKGSINDQSCRRKQNSFEAETAGADVLEAIHGLGDRCQVTHGLECLPGELQWHPGATQT